MLSAGRNKRNNNVCGAQEFHEVFPHLVTATDVPRLVKTGDVKWDDVDAAFCCLPHATTQASYAHALLAVHYH